MNETLARRVRLFYGIFFSVFTAVLGLLFILGAADIYFSDVALGEAKYSREIVGEHLKPILIVMAVWIVAAIAGYVLSVVLPAAQEAKKKPSAAASLKRIKDKIPAGSSEEFLAAKKDYDRMEIIRFAIWSFCALFALASSIWTIVYLAGKGNFDTQGGSIPFNPLVIKMVKNIGPWILVSFLLFVGATLYDYFSAKRELDVAKKLLVLGKGSPKAAKSALRARWESVNSVVGKPKVKMAVRIAVLTIAIAFIVIGNLPINRGGISFAGFNEVMTKAINICTECIGLG